MDTLFLLVFPYFFAGALAAGSVSTLGRSAGWPSGLMMLPLIYLCHLWYKVHIATAARTEPFLDRIGHSKRVAMPEAASVLAEPNQDEPGRSSLSETGPAFTRVSRILAGLAKSRATLRLRTKPLLLLVLLITALTCATLLAVRHSAQLQVRRQIDQDARNALLTRWWAKLQKL